jgi:hypothetical protein
VGSSKFSPFRVPIRVPFAARAVRFGFSPFRVPIRVPFAA